MTTTSQCFMTDQCQLHVRELRRKVACHHQSAVVSITSATQSLLDRFKDDKISVECKPNCSALKLEESALKLTRTQTQILYPLLFTPA